MRDYNNLKHHSNLKWALVCFSKTGSFFQEGCRFNVIVFKFRKQTQIYVLKKLL